MPEFRMMEKNQMLDQLYTTLKQLKQQYEASRQVQAPALCTVPCNTAFWRPSRLCVPACCDERGFSASSKDQSVQKPHSWGICLQEAAEATQGLQQAQGQVQQHLAAVQEAHKLQEGASAALASLSLRCEGLAETTAAESAARQVGRRCQACDCSRRCTTVRRAPLSLHC